MGWRSVFSTEDNDNDAAPAVRAPGQSHSPRCSPAAAAYPSKAITLVCPWGAGGGTDRIARYLADQLSTQLGQPVAVVNQTGGNGAVGHNAGALAAPDGYTLLSPRGNSASSGIWAGLRLRPEAMSEASQ